MREAAGQVVSWVRRGLLAGALLGSFEAVERAWAVREFLRGPAQAAAFGALALAFCVGTAVVVGLAAGLLAALLGAVRRRPLPRAPLRALLGAALGLGLAQWVLYAFTLTVRFDRILARAGLVSLVATAGGLLAGLAWPLLAAAWGRIRGGRGTAAATGVLLGAGLVVLHLWNAHFAPQSSLGVHVVAGSVLLAATFLLVTLIPGGPRGRGLAAALAAVAGLLAWTHHTMNADPVLENLLKTRGSISAHAVRMWSALLDLDRDGRAPALLVGGGDPDNFDAARPGPLVEPDPAPGATFTPGTAPADAPHIVLLTLDACRLDVVPPYTPERSRLGALLPPRPGLEALAQRTARFLVAYTPSAGTEDTFAAMFSGWDLPGILAGVPRDRFLASRLLVAGYAVRGFANDRGFSVSSFEHGRIVRYRLADGRRMLRDAVAFLDSLPPGRPGFAWVHVMDLHADLLKPFALETFSHRAHLEHYSRALARVDSMVASFVAALDSVTGPGRTLLVMTADHGEELGGHGHYHHNLSLYQPAIRVPLWIMGPGVEPGERAARVSLQTIYPTLLEAAGLAPGLAAGRSLWPVLRGEAPAASDPQIYSFLPQRGFSQIYARGHRPELGQATLFDAVRRRKVIIRLGLESWEAYDVLADSMERWNLAGSALGWPDSLRRQLEDMIHERRSAPPRTRPRRRRRRPAAVSRLGRPWRSRYSPRLARAGDASGPRP